MLNEQEPTNTSTPTAPAQTAPTPTISSPPSAPPASSWYDELPDGLKGEKSLESFKGKPLSAVVESYINAQKAIGSRVALPQPNDTPEVRAEKLSKIYQALGRPESPEKYQIEKPAYQELGLQENPELLGAFTQVAHKLGLTNEQVQALINWQAEVEAAQRPDVQGQIQAAIKALQEGDEHNPGWGSTTPKFVALARRAVDGYFDKATQAEFEQTGVFNHPGFIRAMAKIGRALVEDNVLAGEEVDTSGTAKTAQQELAEIMSNPKGPYFDKFHPQHDETVKRALELRMFLHSK